MKQFRNSKFEIRIWRRAILAVAPLRRFYAANDPR